MKMSVVERTRRGRIASRLQAGDLALLLPYEQLLPELGDDENAEVIARTFGGRGVTVAGRTRLPSGCEILFYEGDGVINLPAYCFEPAKQNGTKGLHDRSAGAIRRLAVTVENKMEVQFFFLLNNTVVGRGGVIFPASGVATFRQLFVAEDCRLQGIGSALLEACEAEACGRGCTGIALTVALCNIQVTEFYRQYGYCLVWQFPDGEMLLHKRLDELPMDDLEDIKKHPQIDQLEERYRGEERGGEIVFPKFIVPEPQWKHGLLGLVLLNSQDYLPHYISTATPDGEGWKLYGDDGEPQGWPSNWPTIVSADFLRGVGVVLPEKLGELKPIDDPASDEYMPDVNMVGLTPLQECGESADAVGRRGEF